MHVAVLESERYPGRGHGHVTFFSPNERRVLNLHDRREKSMAGPWRARGELTNLQTGDVVDLGTIGFPAHNFWPWADHSTLVLNDQRGRTFALDVDQPATRHRLQLGRWPRNVVGSGGGLGLAWTNPRSGDALHTVFDPRGETVAEIPFSRGWCAGFSRDGTLVIEATEHRDLHEIWLNAWSATTGERVGRQELTHLDERFERHIGRERDTFPDRHYIVANSGLWQGGAWRGLRVEIEPRTRTFVAEMHFPTGNVLTAHGKQYTEVTRDWVHLAVDA